jgi:hypothetical protein
MTTMTDRTDWRVPTERPDEGRPLVFKDRSGLVRCGKFIDGRFVDADTESRCDEPISAWAYLSESGVIAERLR